MNRRLFLRNAALLTAGVVAADQLEILERLAPRRLWAGADFAQQARCYTTEDGIPLTDQHGRLWVSSPQTFALIPDGGYEAVTSSPWWVSA